MNKPKIWNDPVVLGHLSTLRKMQPRCSLGPLGDGQWKFETYNGKTGATIETFLGTLEEIVKKVKAYSAAPLN